MEMKQNQTFFQGTYLSLTSLFIGYRMVKYFTDFVNSIFRFHCKIEHKQLNLNKRLFALPRLKLNTKQDTTKKRIDLFLFIKCIRKNLLKGK